MLYTGVISFIMAMMISFIRVIRGTSNNFILLHWWILTTLMHFILVRTIVDVYKCFCLIPRKLAELQAELDLTLLRISQV